LSRRQALTRHAVAGIQIAATVGLLWFVGQRVDLGELSRRLAPSDILWALLMGVAVISVQAVLAAIRLRICVRLLGHELPIRSAWVSCQYAGFFSHTPISFLGGDAMRVWHLTTSGVSLTDSAKAVLVDRALGFMGMMLIVLVITPPLLGAIRDPAMWAGYLLLVAVGLLAAAAFVLLGRFRAPRVWTGYLRWVAEFTTASRHLTSSASDASKAFALAVVVNLGNIVAIWGIGCAYGFELGFREVAVAAPVVFLISMIPISVAGWGLREGAFVVALGLFQIPEGTSLAVSVTFGIALLLAYCPAPVILLLARRKRRGGATT
jgi:uncharacterized membrane protein YbhN (UPF0104 family)